MQLLCSGSYLDLPANQQLQFKDDNPLFAFDKIACERTTEFSLPCTPTNDKVFGLARIPAYTGAGMRQKFAAQLIEGQVIKQGYLYVTAFDGKQYKCTFVTGELLGLQAVKNAGKVADVLRANIAAYTNNHSALYEYGGQTRPVRDDNREVDEVAYRKQSGLCLPSIDIYWMINSALTELGVPHSIDIHNFRIIPLQLKAFNNTDIQLVRTTTAMSLPTGILADYFSIVQSSFLYYTYRCYEDHDDPSIIHKIPTQETISCNALQCSVDITFTFPLDAVDLVVVVPDGTLEPQQISDRHFILDTAILEGTPVAGGSVDIPKNTPFFICKSGDYVKDMDKQPLPYPQEWQEEWGWNIRNNSITQTATAESSGDVVAGDKIVIADNLPDVSVIELCKIYAALTGTALNYDEQQGLTFDEIGIDDWEVKDLSQLTKRGEVKRTFSDYAQTNKIVFESGSGVMNEEKVSQSYLVPNDNIDSEKELQKIPFSEGGAIGTDVYVRDNEDKEVIAAGYAGEQMPYMLHISLPKNEGLQSLCDASTQITIESRMSLLEYNSIKPNTLLQVEGSQYVWNSRNWQKNIANMVLASTNVIVSHDHEYPLPSWCTPLDYIDGVTTRRNFPPTELSNYPPRLSGRITYLKARWTSAWIGFAFSGCLSLAYVGYNASQNTTTWRFLSNGTQWGSDIVIPVSLRWKTIGEYIFEVEYDGLYMQVKVYEVATSSYVINTSILFTQSINVANPYITMYGGQDPSFEPSGRNNSLRYYALEIHTEGGKFKYVPCSFPYQGGQREGIFDSWGNVVWRFTQNSVTPYNPSRGGAIEEETPNER